MVLQRPLAAKSPIYGWNKHHHAASYRAVREHTTRPLFFTPNFSILTSSIFPIAREEFPLCLLPTDCQPLASFHSLGDRDHGWRARTIQRLQHVHPQESQGEPRPIQRHTIVAPPMLTSLQCDQAAPHCGNCRKSNRLCTGYERKVSYVFSDDVNLSESDRSALSRQPETTAAVTCSRRSKKAAAAAAAAQGPRKFTFLSYGAPRPSAEEQAPGRHHQHRMLAMPCGKALRSQFHAIFMDRQLPDELLGVRYSVSGSGGGGGVDELTGNWLAYLQGRAVDSPALEMALAAFMAANVGEMNRDDDLVARSRDMYAQGVGCLREALADRRTRLSDEALAACMALSLYELSVDQDPASAYKTHLLGAMALLQMRGPDGINSPLWHSLFLGLRRQIVSLAP